MKGGFNNPPNLVARRGAGNPVRRASMKGGFNNPPNLQLPVETAGHTGASMKGGFNNPPNCGTPQRCDWKSWLQ